MTREEVIAWFRESPFYHKDHEPFNMAIKALEQESCEDAITRILKRMWNCRGNHTTSIDKVKMEQIIRDELPSVKPQEPSDISNDGTLTVNVEDGRKISRVLVCGANHWGGLYYPDEQEPKTGHWISHYDEDEKVGWYECDRCHTERAFNTDYCPDCGAKMESEGKA